MKASAATCTSLRPARTDVMQLRPTAAAAAILRGPAVVAICVMLAIRAVAWGPDSALDPFYTPTSLVLLMFAYFASPPVHEWLHLVGFRMARGEQTGDVGVRRIGLVWFAWCTIPLRVNAVRRALALPGAVLGIVPLCLSLFVGPTDVGNWLWAYGSFMIAAALVDIRVLWDIRAMPADALVTIGPPDDTFPPYPTRV